MARGNECLNEWVVDRLAASRSARGGRIVEIGPGPGVGLSYVLAAFPTAQVWGIDQSAVMLRQARHRNAAAIRTGRLTLTCAGAAAVREVAPVDLVIAVNVMYFWQDPQAELGHLEDALCAGGTVGLGYQLRKSMPPAVQASFARAGHHLYASDEEVTALLSGAGLGCVDVYARGPFRLQLARAV
jgi:trans-aconitate methyltransferase